MKAKSESGANDARHAYRKANNKVKRMMRKAKRNFERSIAQNSKSCPKSFWSYVRSKLRTKAGVAPLLNNVTDKTSVKFTDEEKSNILQDQFSSVFTREPDGPLPPFEKQTDKSIFDILVSQEMVHNQIKILNPNKSCGPDDIHSRLLLELADEMAEPIAIILNRTMKEGTLPNDWKKAYVTPIYKKGAKNKAENYRPVSLTSIICKLMEKIIKEAIMKHIVDNNLLSKNQFGFVTGRSTVTQLLKYLDECIDEIVDGGIIDVIYMDFAKAFDTVPHRRLMHKLEAYGIRGMINGRLSAFLSNRSQVVKVNGTESRSSPVISGIPQGSVLGPLLFVLYINDLPEQVTSSVFLFADDTKVLRKVTSLEDAVILQNDLEALERWSDKWLLEFNPDKCHVLSLGKFEKIRHTHHYSLCGEELDHVFEEKDLGIIIDADLKFEEHMASKVNKANAIMGLIRRTFSFLDGKLFKQLYTSFVRPHLEYGQAVWSPYLMKHIGMIENVQKRATKLVDGLNNMEYTERLQILKLPTLVYRRARGDMAELFKHFHVYDRETLSRSFKPRDRSSRHHQYQLMPNKAKDGLRGIQNNSFYHRTIDIWNNLPRKVVDAGNINGFKNKLDE